MKKILDNNKISTSDILISAQGIIPKVAVLKDIKPSYVTDAQGKRTEQIDAFRLECANPKDFSNFILKVLSTKPVITSEELEAAEEAIYISIPVNEVSIKPYKIEYGIATVSIVAPYVQLVSDAENTK